MLCFDDDICACYQRVSGRSYGRGGSNDAAPGASDPVDVPVHQPVRITVSGLPAGKVVTVALQADSAAGGSWVSKATFRASNDGTIDLATSAALGGSYKGLNPMGLIETLQPSPLPTAPQYFYWSGSTPQSFHISVSAGRGHAVAKMTFLRAIAAPGVSVTNEALAHTGFYGQMYSPPPGTRAHAAVLLFGGSEGGLDGQLQSAALASAGYPTLNVAYFGEPGLPSQLENIPLEYFARALRWLAKQPDVLPKQIWVSGWSRGSEAALLLGAHYPGLVHGVIAGSPSDISFASASGTSPAWTFQGKPVPYSRHFSDTKTVVDAAANIPVQDIKAPVLLDCGTADQVWTSCAYAQAIERRLATHHDRYPYSLFEYQGAGHLVCDLVPYEPVFDPSYMQTISGPSGDGSTPLANANADARLWPYLLQFLVRPSSEQGTTVAPSTPPALRAP